MLAMVIDDSRTIRSVIGRILRELNFEVVEAGNGREALEKLKANGKLDVALVDWNMPEMNGLEFVRAVRTELGDRTLPMVMVTTETEMDQVAKAMAAGASEYIMKPFTKDMIVEKLRILGVLLS